VKSSISLNDFMVKNKQAFDFLTRIRTENEGRVYYQYCQTLSIIWADAKLNKLLPEIKQEVLQSHDIGHSTSVKMRAIYDFWKNRSKDELNVFYRKFPKNKSKLEFLSSVIRNKRKENGKFGRLVRIDIDTSDISIFIELENPTEVYEIDDITFKQLKLKVFSN
jgi:hypothetical protein